MSAQWFYTIAIGVVGGIALRSFFVFGWPVIYTIVLVALALSLVVRVYKERDHQKMVALLAAFLFAVAIGAARMEVAEVGWPQASPPIGTETFEGVVVREPDVRESSQHVYVRTDNGLLLVITDPYQAITYGDRLRIIGVRTLPEVFTTDYGREFDYPGYLKARGVEQVVRYPVAVSAVSSGEGNMVRAKLFALKNWFSKNTALVLPNPALGLGLGVLLGEQQALSAATLNDFRAAGVIHIVVLSGQNIMYVVGFVLVLSRLVRRRYRMWLALCCIFAFALMVGLSATVARASIMAALFIIAYSLGRQYAVLRALVLAALVMLGFNPYLLLYDIGFQLSFMATLGLIAAAPLFTAPQAWSFFGFLRALIVTTVAAQVAVLPLLIYHMGFVSIVSIVANMLIVPMVPVAMVLTFITGLAAGVSGMLGSVVAYGAYLALSYILFVAHMAAAIPFATVALPPWPGYSVVIMYSALGYVWYRSTHKHPHLITANDETADWEVLEEADIEKGAAGKPAAPSQEVPIFFR